MNERNFIGKIETDKDNLLLLLKPEDSFDVIYRMIKIGEKDAYYFFIDGFCKDEMMQKILQKFMDIKKEDMPIDANQFMEKQLPYVEVESNTDIYQAVYSVLCGMTVLLIDGYSEGIFIDARTYPARGVTEPDKDKALRGSKDGFVETIIFNTALIRRRIRSADLHMDILNVGTTSKTDVVICYMGQRADLELVQKIKDRINALQIDALSLNQETLAECLYQKRWMNPFPKFKYTERPDAAAAQIVEGNIILLVDNSPSAMILPVSLFDILEEPDDFYLPPITGTYLRLARLLIGILTYIVTPTFLLFMMHKEWVPKAFDFILLQDDFNIPLVWQFLILEIAIDGLKLAAINTPNMLSTPLSIMAALVLGEFSVQSGWFNAEVMLYMAFVALSNYTQASYELGYALKFMRMLTLILTAVLDWPGYLLGVGIFFFMLFTNQTVGNKPYLSPLVPLDKKGFSRIFFRKKVQS